MKFRKKYVFLPFYFYFSFFLGPKLRHVGMLKVPICQSKLKKEKKEDLILKPRKGLDGLHLSN